MDSLRRWSTLGMALLMVATSSACMFDCHDASATACGGIPTYTTATIFPHSRSFLGALDGASFRYNARVDGPPVTPYYFSRLIVNAVNLSNRGITSIAPSGLECYNFSNVGCTEYSQEGGMEFMNTTNSSIQAILLDGNQLTAVPNMSVFSGACYVSLANNRIGGALPSNMFAGYSTKVPPTMVSNLFVDFQANNINGTSYGTFIGECNNNITAQGDDIGSIQVCFHRLVVNLQNNNFNMRALANGTFAGLAFQIGGALVGLCMQIASFTAVNFASCNIGGTLTGAMLATELPSDGVMMMDFTNNSISKLEPGEFSIVTGADNAALFFLQNNTVDTLEAGTFGFNGHILNVNLSFNPIGSVEDGVMANISANTQAVSVYLEYANINTLGAIFSGLAGSSDLQYTVGLSENQIDGESLKTALNSLTSTPSSIYLYLDNNNITTVPGQLFTGIGVFVSTSQQALPYLSVSLQYNPISSMNSSAFTAGTVTFDAATYDWANLGNVEFVLDNPTAGPIHIDGPLAFDGIQWPNLYSLFGSSLSVGSSTGGAFTISFINTSVNLTVVKALGSVNPPGTLNVILQKNGYTEIPSGAFSDTFATGIDLSNNAITHIAADAFTHNFNLQALLLSNNQLGFLPTATLNALPVLSDLQIRNNSIWAIQQTNTHLSNASYAANNIINCSSFGSNTSGCVCPSGHILSSHCGFWRCTATSEHKGCPQQGFFLTAPTALMHHCLGVST